MTCLSFWGTLFSDAIMLVYRSVMVQSGNSTTRWQWIPSRELNYTIPKVCLKMTFPSPRWDMLVPQKVEHLSYEDGFSPGSLLQPIYLGLGYWSMFSFQSHADLSWKQKKHRLEKQGYAIKVSNFLFRQIPQFRILFFMFIFVGFQGIKWVSNRSDVHFKWCNGVPPR